MMEPKSDSQVFQGMLEDLYQQVDLPGPLQKFRHKAWDHFLELGLPTRKSEVFRYVKLRQLYANNYRRAQEKTLSKEQIESLLYPECRNSALVFVNGTFQPELSRLKDLPNRLVVLPFSEALTTYGAFFQNQWAKSLKEETDPFAALNAATHQQGAFVYLPPKTVIETPIQFLNIIDLDESEQILVPRLHLFVGMQGQMNLYSSHAVLRGDNFCTNWAAEFFLEEDAHVTYTQVSTGMPEQCWLFDALRASLKRNSTLKTILVTAGSETVRHDYRIALTGENAEALLNGVWMLNHKNEAHIHVIMDHQAPFCRSLQRFKGVLDDVSQSSFEGKILVRQPAQKTEAFQLNHNLLMSDKANAQSKPNLEIFADDVKASHGATVGQLDQEQLFYMKTRGFGEAEAKNMLISAYCKEVTDLITLPSLLASLTQSINSYIRKE
jgi:Fe-S cluster assembly protein SufD